MRSVTRAYFFTFVLMLAFSGLLAVPLAVANEDGYRLLELDGYKVKWGEGQLGVGARISYAFAQEDVRFERARNCRQLAPIDTLLGATLSAETLARETAAAFRVWERAAGLSFYKVDDVREADIVLGAQGLPRGRAFANVSHAPGPQATVGIIDRALVCLNPDMEWKVGFDGNKNVYDIRYTLIHEIGHAIGLDHPGPSGQVMGFRYTEAFAELQPGDLSGVRLLYGEALKSNEPVNGLASQLAPPGVERFDVDELDESSALNVADKE